MSIMKYLKEELRPIYRGYIKNLYSYFMQCDKPIEIAKTIFVYLFEYMSGCVFLVNSSGVENRSVALLKARIKEKGLENHIKPIGAKENPIPYMAKADALLLPSRNEGKPMVVTESFIMGLVPVVTKYSSANEQIENGVDGLVFENSEEGLYKGLKDFISNPAKIEQLKNNVVSKNYGNENKISLFYDIINKLL